MIGDWCVGQQLCISCFYLIIQAMIADGGPCKHGSGILFARGDQSSVCRNSLWFGARVAIQCKSSVYISETNSINLHGKLNRHCKHNINEEWYYLQTHCWMLYSFVWIDGCEKMGQRECPHTAESTRHEICIEKSGWMRVA